MNKADRLKKAFYAALLGVGGFILLVLFILGLICLTLGAMWVIVFGVAHAPVWTCVGIFTTILITTTLWNYCSEQGDI